MSDPDLPLHGLFSALRDAGLPLGVSDYLALLGALRAGEGADRPALVRLCRMLWTSSVAEGALLERLFQRFAPPVLTEGEVPPEIQRLMDPGPAPDTAPSEKPSGEAPPAATARLPPSAAQAPSGGPRPLGAAEIAAATVQGGSALLDLLPGPRGLAHGEYLPVTHRQLGQSWRRLRRTEAQGPRTEIDVPATIAAVARSGQWTGPVLSCPKAQRRAPPRARGQGRIHDPLHPLTQRITDSAVHGSGLGRVDVVQFHNYAVDFVERGPDTLALLDLLARLPEATGALFVGDAGAARGRHSTERVEGTRLMLERVRARLRRVAWINPVPRARWLGTSAQDVFRMVPMFEAHRAGFDAALRVLRGRRPFPHGVSPWGKP